MEKFEAALRRVRERTPLVQCITNFVTVNDCANILLASGASYLNSDFKKKNGYKRSVELSEQYGMYRQYYCGCVFSKRERDAQIAAKAAAQGI